MADIYSRTILADAPFGYWRLGELSGSTASDSSGNGYSGTIGGSVSVGWAGAIAGSNAAAASFPGGTPIANGVALPDMTANTLKTVEAWLYPAVSYSGTVDNGTYVGGGPYAAIGNANKPAMYVDTDGWQQSDHPLVVGGWNHVVWVREVSGTLRLYVDGELRWSSAGAVGAIVFLSAPVIGTRTDFGTSGFNGLISEVAFYASPLSAERVAAHYRAGVAMAFGPRRTGMSGGFDM